MTKIFRTIAISALFAATTTTATTVLAAETTPAEKEKRVTSTVVDKEQKVPKLVVQIIVGQMRYDVLSRFGSNFSDFGFKRLLKDGVSCSNARYNFMFTQNSPCIATMVTGTQPSQHGIIGDGWINYTTNESISSVIDKGVRGVGCQEDRGQFSPKNMMVSTVADELKRHYPNSKVVSIAHDAPSAVLAGGYTPNRVYWCDPQTGSWATSSYYTQSIPLWVTNFNDIKRKETYTNDVWTLTMPYNKYKNKQASAIILDTTAKFTFEMLFKPKNTSFDRLRRSPSGNTYLKDFAKEVISRDTLGGDATPDFLIINFGAQKNITELFGVESTEYEDSYYKLDKDLGDLIDFLENKLGKDNVVIVLSADHGTSDNVTIDSDRNRGGKFNAMQFKVLINGFLSAQLGQGTWVSEYRNRQIYLNRRQIYEKGLSLADIQNRVATFALQFGGVAQAVTATALQNNYYAQGIMQKVQNSFYPKNSGDVIINLLPGWIELENEEASWVKSSSGSPYEYDTHIPLIWYGGKIASTTVHRQIDMTSVAPTLCDIFGIIHPNASEGATITEVSAQL